MRIMRRRVQLHRERNRRTPVNLVRRRIPVNLVSRRILVNLVRRRILVNLVRRRILVNLVRRRILVNLVRRRILVNLVRRRILVNLVRRRILVNLVSRRIPVNLVSRRIPVRLAQINTNKEAYRHRIQVSPLLASIPNPILVSRTLLNLQRAKLVITRPPATLLATIPRKAGMVLSLLLATLPVTLSPRDLACELSSPAYASCLVQLC